MRNVTLYRCAGAVLMTRRRVRDARADLRIHPERWIPVYDSSLPLLAVGESLEVRR